MEWLNPLLAVYAGAAAVPALVLMYFLKMKRREQPISSTLLWKRAVQDLQVNAPFQRIRRNILLLLQMLMLLAMLAALAGPVRSMLSGTARRHVLLIDRSASMNATDADGKTRLEAAKAQAREFVGNLRKKRLFSLTDTADKAMVVAYGGRAQVMCNYTSNKEQLVRAIEAIGPGDGPSRLAEALTISQAFLQTDDEAGAPSPPKSAQLLLFSDGSIQDREGIFLNEGELLFYRMGSSGDNVAITAMQARRAFEKPEEIHVFATLSNYNDQPVTCDVQLSLNETVRTVRQVTAPAATVNEAAFGEQEEDAFQPGEVGIHFQLTTTETGVMTLEHLYKDSLPDDNAAWAVLTEPQQLSVLLVSGGNPVLETALRACGFSRVESASPTEFDGMNHDEMTVRRPYDVIVLDGHGPAQYPRTDYLVFGQPPAGTGVTITQLLKNQVMVDWRPQHPVMRYVTPGNVFVGKSLKYDLPRDADVLAEMDEGPAVAYLRRRNSGFLLVSFDVLESNWPFEPGFVLFCYNAVHFLGEQGLLDEDRKLRPGEPLIWNELPAEAALQVTGPDGRTTKLQTDARGQGRFAGTDRAGVYRLEVQLEDDTEPRTTERYYAVNLFDAKESHIKPSDELQLGGQAVTARETPAGKSHVPLWPWLVMLTIMLAGVEWYVYNTKVKL